MANINEIKGKFQEEIDNAVGKMFDVFSSAIERVYDEGYPPEIIVELYDIYTESVSNKMYEILSKGKAD